MATLIFWRPAYDTFNLPKVLVAALGAGIVVGVLAVAISRRHGLVIPWAPAVPAVVLFAAAAIVAAAFAGAPLRALSGASAARSGLVLYLSCAALCLGAATFFRASSARWPVWILLATAVPAAAYGGLQWAGADPFGWHVTSGGPQIFSSLGNPNFLSAWLGIVSVLALWGALTTVWARPWRIASALVGIACFVVAVATASVQGPLAAVAGALVLALGGTRRASSRRRLPAAGTAAAVLVAIAGWLVAAGEIGRSLDGRLWKWSAALGMAADRPLTGVGLDLYADWYHAYRPLADAMLRGVQRTADAAHNVPLQLLAGGGIVLLLAYVGVVAVTGYALVMGLRRHDGETRLLLAALGGAWVAYHLQSLVSIDVAPLALLHWLLAGLIIAVGTPDAAPRLRRCAHEPMSLRAATAVTAIAGLALVGWSVPLRADLAAGRAERFARAGDDVAAERSYALARRLAPWDVHYDFAYGRHLADTGDVDAALAVLTAAHRKAPRQLSIALSWARVAARDGRFSEAARAYEVARVIDPRSPDLIAEETLNERKIPEPISTAAFVTP